MVTSVWWRAEVVSTIEVDGRRKAQLRYEGRDGFEEQVGEVWLFPLHVRPVEDESTQLRWRFYECSGNVTYNIIDADNGSNQYMVAPTSKPESQHIISLQSQVAHLAQQYEELEGMVIGQGELLGRVVGSESTADQICERIFTILLHKLAVLMQRPLPSGKSRREEDAQSSFFEVNCAGSLTTDVDCDLEIFRAIARLEKSKTPATTFRPGFFDTQYPPADLEEAEIVFQNLGDLAHVIGITSVTDLTNMAIRERRNSGGRHRASSDVALRVLGTCIMNEKDEQSSSAMLVCQSIDEQCLLEVMDMFIRDSREFDFAARSYTKKLVHRHRHRQSTGLELLKAVFESQFSKLTEKQVIDAAKEICTI